MDAQGGRPEEAATEQPAEEVVLADAERLKTFIDAVVAIALTLLILPLMESVGEFAAEGEGAAEWVAHETPQLLTFVLSFVLIATFWMSHHRLFARVESTTVALMWLMFGWMLSIVWLPVATAISGQMPPRTVEKILYIGALILAGLFSLFTRLYLRSHPQLHAIPAARLRRGTIADASMVVLFALALGISIVVPELTYWPLLLLLLVGPVTRILARPRR